jgi:hypothetical protein
MVSLNAALLISVARRADASIDKTVYAMRLPNIRCYKTL